MLQCGGGNKAIYTSMINHDLTTNLGILIKTATFSNTKVNIPIDADIINLTYNTRPTSPIVSDYKTSPLTDVNTIIVDEPLKIKGLSFNINSSGYVLYLSDSYKDSDIYKINGGTEKVLSVEEFKEELKPHIFNASGINGGFRALSVSDPAFVRLMKSMADNKTLEIKISKDSIVDTIVVDCNQTIWRKKLCPELFDKGYKIKFDQYTYIIINTLSSTFDADDRKVKYKKFKDYFLIDASGSYIFYVLNSGLYVGIKNSECAALVVNKSVNFYNLSKANDGEDYYTFYSINNYGSNYSFIHHEKIIVMQTINNSGIWRSHNSLSCVDFYNRGYAGFYHEDLDNEGKDDSERFNITLTGYFATNETGITKFGSKYDVVFKPKDKTKEYSTIITNNGGSFNFADNSKIKITSSNKNKKFVVSNFGTLKFDNDLILDNTIEFFNHDEGIIYLEKNFSVDKLNNLIFNNHDLIVNSSSIELSKLLSLMKQTETGRLLNISDSSYYSPNFSNGVNIYNNFDVYSDIVKYLYSSNADTKDLQILTLLNEYKSNKAVLSLENDLRKIKLFLFLICERLRIPNISKVC